ncbi:hypothetical protein [Methylomicrobium sp. Wu6]|uniref:hypothetical protein n=1 Tax=Methylomicrobium sp. Wu6 TaxID=3107928 RepID=UPI002DD6325F|nr:hypothetical protein [Methylomicrobium sp. Wu6]MEC4748496.1 hypothetical protein [Methylomicrobium sp. Wu6]
MILEGAVDKNKSIMAFSGNAGYREAAVKFSAKTLERPLPISEKIEGKRAVLPTEGRRWDLFLARRFSPLG